MTQSKGFRSSWCAPSIGCAEQSHGITAPWPYHVDGYSPSRPVGLRLATQASLPQRPSSWLTTNYPRRRQRTFCSLSLLFDFEFAQRLRCGGVIVTNSVARNTPPRKERKKHAPIVKRPFGSGEVESHTRRKLNRWSACQLTSVSLTYLTTIPQISPSPSTKDNSVQTAAGRWVVCAVKTCSSAHCGKEAAWRWITGALRLRLFGGTS